MWGPPHSLPSSGSIRSRGNSKIFMATLGPARPPPWRGRPPSRERTKFRKVNPRRRGRAAGGPIMWKKHAPYLDVSASGISRRRLMQGAAGLGLAAAVPDVGSRATVARVAAQESGGPGPAAERLIFSAFNVDQAPVEITQDKMDLYLYGLKAAGAEDLAGAEGVRVIQAPASTLSLILNPAPAREEIGRAHV